MLKPKKCPKCGAGDDQIQNVEEMCDSFGIDKESQTKKEWVCQSCTEFFDTDGAELTAWYKDQDYSKMSLFKISDVVYADWGDKISPKALHYLEALANLDSMDDNFGSDTAEYVVTYFLLNAKEWKGETARGIKKALNRMLKDRIRQNKQN